MGGGILRIELVETVAAGIGTSEVVSACGVSTAGAADEMTATDEGATAEEIAATEEVTAAAEVAAIEEACAASPDATTEAIEEAIDKPSEAGMGMPKAVPQAISCIIVVVANSVTVTGLLNQVSRLCHSNICDR